MVEQLLLFSLDAVKDGDGMVGHAVVVAPHQRGIIGVGTDDGQRFLVFLQRQDMVLVLQPASKGYFDNHSSYFYQIVDDNRIRNI